MNEFISESGAKIKINIASFKDAIKLKSAIQKEYAKSGIKISGNIRNFNIADSDIDFNSIAQIIMSLDSSEEIYNALFACLIKCTYNSEKITENTFEPIEARQDFYQIVIECLKVNFQPFLKGLASRLRETVNEFLTKPEDIQK